MIQPEWGSKCFQYPISRPVPDAPTAQRLSARAIEIRPSPAFHNSWTWAESKSDIRHSRVLDQTGLGYGVFNRGFPASKTKLSDQTQVFSNVTPPHTENTQQQKSLPTLSIQQGRKPV